MHLLRVENEDNAVTCLKTIIDLHRSYKQILESQVQPFIDIVQEMYRNMEQTVKDQFDNPGTPLGATVSMKAHASRLFGHGRNDLLWILMIVIFIFFNPMPYSLEAHRR